MEVRFRLNEALIDLRRFWQHPGLQRRFLDELDMPVELSVLRTMRAIALVVDASTASRLVDQAVSAGYVVRTTSKPDRRRTVLALSSDGVEVLARANQVRRSLLRALTAHWPDKNVETLTRLLREFRESVACLELGP